MHAARWMCLGLSHCDSLVGQTFFRSLQNTKKNHKNEADDLIVEEAVVLDEL